MSQQGIEKTVVNRKTLYPHSGLRGKGGTLDNLQFCAGATCWSTSTPSPSVTARIPSVSGLPSLPLTLTGVHGKVPGSQDFTLSICGPYDQRPENGGINTVFTADQQTCGRPSTSLGTQGGTPTPSTSQVPKKLPTRHVTAWVKRQDRLLPETAHTSTEVTPNFSRSYLLSHLRSNFQSRLNRLPSILW